MLSFLFLPLILVFFSGVFLSFSTFFPSFFLNPDEGKFLGVGGGLGLGDWKPWLNGTGLAEYQSTEYKAQCRLLSGLVVTEPGSGVLST